ncbi:hypothetical protein JXA85_06375 [Candidatus Woesearchaeota archaeon]|nr:hypothetical protein [Candidatus Woesearchaeota archaeon]
MSEAYNYNAQKDSCYNIKYFPVDEMGTQQTKMGYSDVPGAVTVVSKKKSPDSPAYTTSAIRRDGSPVIEPREWKLTGYDNQDFIVLPQGGGFIAVLQEHRRIVNKVLTALSGK